jgi:hypothetical protein
MATDTKTERPRRRSSSSRSAGSADRSDRADRSSRRRRSDTNATAEDRKFLDRHGERLSPSTRRARWIHSPDEKPERRGQTLATRSGDVIRAWADARDGRPATATRGDDGRPRTLRITFADRGSGDGRGGDSGGRRRREEISWGEWLGVFDQRDLVFLYQEERRDGRQSNFFRLDNPTREDG